MGNCVAKPHDDEEDKLPPLSLEKVHEGVSKRGALTPTSPSSAHTRKHTPSSLDLDRSARNGAAFLLRSPGAYEGSVHGSIGGSVHSSKAANSSVRRGSALYSGPQVGRPSTGGIPSPWDTHTSLCSDEPSQRPHSCSTSGNNAFPSGALLHTLTRSGRHAGSQESLSVRAGGAAASGSCAANAGSHSNNASVRGGSLGLSPVGSMCSTHGAGAQGVGGERSVRGGMHAVLNEPSVRGGVPPGNNRPCPPIMVPNPPMEKAAVGSPVSFPFASSLPSEGLSNSGRKMSGGPNSEPCASVHSTRGPAKSISMAQSASVHRSSAYLSTLHASFGIKESEEHREDSDRGSGNIVLLGEITGEDEDDEHEGSFESKLRGKEHSSSISSLDSTFKEELAEARAEGGASKAPAQDAAAGSGIPGGQAPRPEGSDYGRNPTFTSGESSVLRPSPLSSGAATSHSDTRLSGLEVRHSGHKHSPLRVHSSMDALPEYHSLLACGTQEASTWVGDSEHRQSTAGSVPQSEHRHSTGGAVAHRQSMSMPGPLLSDDIQVRAKSASSARRSVDSPPSGARRLQQSMSLKSGGDRRVGRSRLGNCPTPPTPGSNRSTPTTSQAQLNRPERSRSSLGQSNQSHHSSVDLDAAVIAYQVSAALQDDPFSLAPNSHKSAPGSAAQALQGPLRSNSLHFGGKEGSPIHSPKSGPQTLDAPRPRVSLSDSQQRELKADPSPFASSFAQDVPSPSCGMSAEQKPRLNLPAALSETGPKRSNSPVDVPSPPCGSSAEQKPRLNLSAALSESGRKRSHSPASQISPSSSVKPQDKGLASLRSLGNIFKVPSLQNRDSGSKDSSPHPRHEAPESPSGLDMHTAPSSPSAIGSWAAAHVLGSPHQAGGSVRGGRATFDQPTNERPHPPIGGSVRGGRAMFSPPAQHTHALPMGGSVRAGSAFFGSVFGGGGGGGGDFGVHAQPPMGGSVRAGSAFFQGGACGGGGGVGHPRVQAVGGMGGSVRAGHAGLTHAGMTHAGMAHSSGSMDLSRDADELVALSFFANRPASGTPRSCSYNSGSAAKGTGGFSAPNTVHGSASYKDYVAAQAQPPPPMVLRRPSASPTPHHAPPEKELSPAALPAVGVGVAQGKKHTAWQR